MPRVAIRLDVIERNARVVTQACGSYGVGVFGVTKGACGMPHVARAMLRGGVIGIGESRYENIRRLRRSGLDCPVLLLRSPPLSRADETVRLADISLNSELEVIEELSRAAERRAKVHDVILMVDLGDLREGVWPDDLMWTVERVLALPGVRLVGIGTNLTCFGAVLPSEKNMGELAGYAASIEETFGVGLSYVSGGNSSSLPFLLEGRMPPGVDNLRIGEAILQGGRDTFFDQPWEPLDRDAFLLTGELLEVKVKPSVPIGETGVDAFGGKPVFEDRGLRPRGILNIGREDVAVEVLLPVDPGVRVLGASSDHLIIDVADVRPLPKVGDTVGFHMGYAALLAAMTSEYVEKDPMYDQVPPAPRSVRVVGDPQLMALVPGLPEQLAKLGFGEPGGDESGGDELPLRLGDGRVEGVADAYGLIRLSATVGEVGLAAERPAAEGLSPENTVLVGLREAGPEESAFIKENGLAAYTIVDIDIRGIREVMREAVRTAKAGTRGFVVVYDASVTGADGISARETHQAMELIAASGGMLGLQVIGLNSANAAQITAFILSGFGRTIL
ncbi:alanine racemase [Actinomadura barringtoniae]|uniref:Alanine racemase n=1 Tax=Actinomadura barringtoniae TaxID=1427535 RepID=A0A939PRD3_9ACTN|nr:alanine racemase [Actinomadura barringtoniae]MBO2454799.1 alanine racemase [Actinomadura barringtoniae]